MARSQPAAANTPIWWLWWRRASSAVITAPTWYPVAARHRGVSQTAEPGGGIIGAMMGHGQ